MVAVERFAHDDDRTAATLGTAAMHAFACRLRKLLRDTDTVAALANRDGALAVAAGLHDAARQAVTIEGRSYPLTLAMALSS